MINPLFVQRFASDRVTDLQKSAPLRQFGILYPDAERRPRRARHWANR